jgi:hypothetical protein
MLHQTGSFRAAENYGMHTVKQTNILKEARKPRPPATAIEPSPFTMGVITFIMNLFFFTIPWTYLSHVKASSEYRGRLAGVRQNWERYVERLVREYSDFLLVVSSSARRWLLDSLFTIYEVHRALISNDRAIGCT